MLIYTKITEVQAFLDLARRNGKSIGFVPTMGALHPGHLSLIKTAKAECELVVCSIFVNPTQFNDKNDLDRYPRMPETDAKMLEAGGCDMLFLPSVNEMYPQGSAAVQFHFGHIDQVLEAKHRPGHFNGVAQVVKRFFEIVQPNKAYFGSKDFQQTKIVQALVQHMQSPIQIVTCPILREADGLAMSSRNTLLSPAERQLAGLIPGMMKHAVRIAKDQSISQAKAFIQESIAPHPAFKLDYFELCRATDLTLLQTAKADAGSIALIALFVGKIRLIDNLIV